MADDLSTREVVLGAASINTTALDWRGNLDRVFAAIEEANTAGVQMLLLPELCLSGYGCEDWFASPETWENALRSLSMVASLSPRHMVVMVGLPLYHRNAVFNVVAVITEGRVVGFVPKQNLAGDGIHYEPRWFEAWPAGVTAKAECPGYFFDGVPLGDLVFDLNNIKFAFEVCEDAWVADRPGARHSKQGVDIIFNPSASHFAFGKQETRRRWVEEGSRAFGCAYVYANLVGNEAGRAVYDGGSMIAENGTVIAEGSRFSFKEGEVIYARVDLSTNRSRQSRVFSFHSDPSSNDNVIRKTWEPWHEHNRKIPEFVEGRIFVAPKLSKEEEFTAAVSLGLYDYARKSGQHGWVISLSGGADSAACAVLCKEALDRATDALGLEAVAKALRLWDDEWPHLGKSIHEAAITTAYQPTENSGEVTRAAAEDVAKAVGAKHLVLDLTEAHNAYLSMISGALGRALTWERDDLALQNIQARIRSPSIWMIANIKGCLLLSTSNRSEAAVGYATMDGDTSGGLSPIAGIDKAFLRHWLAWMNEPERLNGALQSVIEQQPTAELRPQDAKQTDEDDLMPYPILDAIEGAAIRDKKGPRATFLTMCRAFPDVEQETMRAYVVKFFRLWVRNQWKRERYAPSFHLDDKNLDPRTWCRFPILSGGFATELKILASQGSTTAGSA